MDDGAEHVHLQAVLTILRHLGRLSEVQPITVAPWMAVYTVRRCMMLTLHEQVLTAVSCSLQLHCQMDEGKFENVYILI